MVQKAAKRLVPALFVPLFVPPQDGAEKGERAMIDEKRWIELVQAEDEAYFKGDLMLSLPQGSYTAEEMWDILTDMFRATIAIQDEMRRDFESLSGLEQVRLFDTLCLSGVKSPEWWFNVLLAEQEPLPEGFLE